MTDDLLALILARYRLRGSETREAWLERLAGQRDGAGRLGSTYRRAWSESNLSARRPPPPPRRWLTAWAIASHLRAAERRCREDRAFSERVGMYGRLLAILDEPPQPLGTRHIVAGSDGTNVEFSNMDDALAYVRALKAGRPQTSSWAP